MTKQLFLAVSFLGLIEAAAPSVASGATPDEIKRSIKAGADALRTRYERGAPGGGVGAGGGIGASGVNQVGTTCLVGLALLEAGAPVNDTAVKAITATVRDAAYSQTNTYSIALCLMYLDRLGEPADVPAIQMLAVRLLVGQTSAGGWGYVCIPAVPADVEQRLRAMRPGAAGKLHPDVEKYGQALTAAAQQTGAAGGDNSNTQFAVLGVWMSRKHGVPVDNALDLVEKRFAATQDQQTGSWPYSGGAAPGSPAMYCAGLLGMATGVARREERRLKAELQAGPKPDGKPADPFYNPPAGAAPQKQPARPADGRDLVVQRAFTGLGASFDDLARNKKLLSGQVAHGHGDYYFLWSLERAGVVYGVDKVGGIDWYAVGSSALLQAQGQNGLWSPAGYGADVNSAFAILFLCKSNLARDLSSKVQKDPTNTELRAGRGASAADLLPNGPTAPVVPVSVPVINLPNPTGDEAIARASALLKASASDWAKLLAETRDGKGPNYTRALVVTAANADAGRKQEVRTALAERLCRMSAATLRGMLKANEVELRRAAALACAMKDDKGHIPDLIDVLADADDGVARAAKAGLKSLTGKDFGPAAGASAGQKALAVTAWRDWYAAEKK
ncbi:hypothetical protein [Frigoriglobus tundricola]|uniref:Squalene cyclase C-terminal domain-containing protein n=1 Tax=Frigoriglobus tundricola TaxID=2774151 RepID=A0A6M5Z2N8_9BACT|nr:hypothetical protein [Frigoriglobus tundricola]QJW99701.1 hypothetical protein FTUN_7322 [Frigoriglobus tundricola]